MATTTMNGALAGHAGTAAAGSFWSKLARGFVEAREAEARRRIALHLAGISDKTLAEIGFSAQEIELMRSGSRVRPELFS